jgi:CHAT domain-containing protein
VLLAAGPGLEHADAEVEAIAALYAGATVLPSGIATVERVRGELATASVAHIACHGRFRADNPLFSALELSGGHLSVFELERLSRVPARLVLSACDAGLSAVHPGDELMGLTAALLRLGTGSLIASVLPVPDGASRRLMVELHRALATGDEPSVALAKARAAGDPEAHDDLVAAAAFQAFGSD